MKVIVCATLLSVVRIARLKDYPWIFTQLSHTTDVRSEWSSFCCCYSLIVYVKYSVEVDRRSFVMRQRDQWLQTNDDYETINGHALFIVLVFHYHCTRCTVHVAHCEVTEFNSSSSTVITWMRSLSCRYFRAGLVHKYLENCRGWQRSQSHSKFIRIGNRKLL